MTYFESIRARRRALDLSIREIAIQTQLPASQLSLIEANELEAFSSDTVYLRILIQAYCHILGISWQSVEKEVEADIQMLINTQFQNGLAENLVIPNDTQTPKRKGFLGWLLLISGILGVYWLSRFAYPLPGTFPVQANDFSDPDGFSKINSEVFV